MANLSNINGKFVVDTAGNIGVGTLTPRSDANTTNISIQSSGTARLFVNNTGASGKEYAIYSSANGDFGIFDYGAVSARLVINSSGNATFAGNQVTVDPASGDAILQLQSSTQTLRIDQNSIRTGTNNNLALFTNGNSNQLVLKQSNGCVGIGTNSPGRGLTIDKSNEFAAFEIIKNNTTNQIVYLGTGSSAGTDDPILQLKHNGTENIRLYATGDSWINGGDLGIGTTSPQDKLNLHTSSASGNIGMKITRGTQTHGLRLGVNDSHAFLWTTEAQNLVFATSGVQRISILSGGNVGIGNTNPGAKLVVGANINSNASGIEVNAGASGGNVLSNGTADNWFPYVDNNNYYSALNHIFRNEVNSNTRMTITSTGAIALGTSATAYGAAGEVLTSNGNASPSWQAAGGGGSAWPQEKFAVYTINSTTSNILIATMNSTTWHGDYLGGCLKFTINDTNYIQVSYVTVYTYLSGTNKWFFKGNTEMTTHNLGTNPFRYVFAFTGAYGAFGPTTTLKINRVSNGGLGPTNVLVQAVSSPDMFILN